MKVGDKLTIHCYKHNGKIDRISGEAIVLDETDEYLVCANNKVKLIENDGRSHRTKEIAILFFYKKEWYNILAQLKKYGLFYYCNIASPYIISTPKFPPWDVLGFCGVSFDTETDVLVKSLSCLGSICRI